MFTDMIFTNYDEEIISNVTVTTILNITHFIVYSNAGFWWNFIIQNEGFFCVFFQASFMKKCSKILSCTVLRQIEK